MQNILQNRRLMIIIGVASLIVIIFGAIFLFSGEERVPIVEQGPITITWWKPFYTEQTYRDAIAAFRSKPEYRNVTIDVINRQYGDNYYRDLISDIARDAGPDIFSIRNDDLPAYKEFMTPIRTFQGAKLNEYRDNFVPLVVRDTMDRDSVYAVTSYVDNLQLYYNETILEQANIALQPTSWEELDRQLIRLNRRDTNALSFNQSAISLGTGGRGIDGDPNINRHQDIIPALIFQNGGQMFDYRTSEPIFGKRKNTNDVTNNLATNSNFSVTGIDEDTPTFRAVRFYSDFADVNKPRYSWNNASDNNIDAFAQGKLAYMIHYSYMQDTLTQRNPRLRYGVAPLPQLDQNLKKTYGFFFMDGLNKNLEKDPSNAYKRKVSEEFLTFLTEYEQQKDFVSKTALPGAHRRVIEDQQSGEQKLRIFANGSLYADNYYKPDVVATERIWSDMIERVQYESMPLSDSIDQAVREYEDIINQGPKLR
jgi:ABC-type glycerol-3-phosphate transport system substrate-binding protein